VSELWLFAAVGLAAGGAYALTAVGIVTVYRGSGVVNFAHGAIGMVGTYAFYEAYRDGDGWPVIPSMALGLAVGAMAGLLMYLLVMRPLRNAVELARLIATLGVLLSLQTVALWRYGVSIEIVPRFLSRKSFELWGAPFRYDTMAVLLLTILIALGMAALFTRTRLGLAATALQERPDAAATLGISPDPAGMVVWAIGGLLAAAAGIFLLPVTGLSPTVLTFLVFPALAAGLLARFRSYPVTIVTGVAIGVFEAVLLSRDVSPVIIRGVPFVIIVVALVIGGTAIPGRGHVERRLPKVTDGAVRLWPVVGLVVVTVVSIAVLASGWSVGMTATGIVMLVGLSIVVATGYAGQITLAPFAIAGLASVAVAWASRAGLPFLAALVVGLLVGLVSGALVGLPAIRVRGMDLAIATLGFALVVSNVVLQHPTVSGGVDGVRLKPAEVLGLDVSPGAHPQRYAMVIVAVVVLSALAVANVRRGRIGRRLVSVRANERGAAALGIWVGGAKVGAFAISGALSGLAGTLITYRSEIATFEQFGVMPSINALMFTVVGGVGLIAGAGFAGVGASGGIFAYLLREAESIERWLPLIAGLFVIYVMLTHPDGEMDRLTTGGRLLLRRLRRQRPSPRSDATPAPAAGQGDRTTGGPAAPPGPVVLEAERVIVAFGAVHAVDDVNLRLTAGRVTGVVGPNGAGKTTFIDAISGFTPLTSGSVRLGTRDISRWAAHRRARAGVARTFQNLELFTDLSVRENLLAATDRRDLAGYVTDLARPGSRHLPKIAVETVELLGLADVVDQRVDDLPQGKQRLVAIARAVAMGPTVLCLDEPTAGLAGGERRAVATAVRTVVERLGVAVMLVEHNIDVVQDLCDEIVVLDFGRIVASGPPNEILASPQVRRAYLGTSDAGPADDSMPPSDAAAASCMRATARTDPAVKA
jgi:sulfate-transporting ATPase